MARTARIFRVGLLALFEHHPSEARENVSHEGVPFARSSQQDQISEHFRNSGCDFHQISLLALQVALQNVVDFTMQAFGHAHSYVPDGCS
jgi:hypothetical protein